MKVSTKHINASDVKTKTYSASSVATKNISASGVSFHVADLQGLYGRAWGFDWGGRDTAGSIVARS